MPASIRRALAGPLAALITLSIVSNLLMLGGPLFMMQVYDRVLTSFSVPTLVALTVIIGVLFAFYGVVESLRSRIVNRLGDVVDARIRPRLFRAGVRGRVGPHGEQVDPTNDSDALRQFMSSAGVLAFLDLPWTPIYLIVIFILHPGLGWLAFGGAIVVTAFMVLNEMLTRRPARRAYVAARVRQSRITDAYVNAESTIAMGMLPEVQDRWETATQEYRRAQASEHDPTTSISAASKAVRFFLQSAVLALGAYFVIQNELTAGAIIAASVLTARALAPIEQVVGHWRSFLAARTAYARIVAVYRLPDRSGRPTRLPQPSAQLEVRDLTLLAPGRGIPSSGESRFICRLEMPSA